MEVWCEMSVSDFGLIFSTILFIFIFFHYIHYTNYQAVENLQVEYNLAVDQAVEAALYDSLEYDTQREIYFNEEDVMETFFQALYVNLGIMEQPMKKELCKFYIPYILFVENDGIVPYIQESSKKNDIVSFESGEKLYYEFTNEKEGELRVTLQDYVIFENDLDNVYLEGYYNDIKEQLPECFQWESNDFYLRKKGLIIEEIQECTNLCIENQNQIAQRFGIDYEFQLPVIEYEDWYRTIEDVSMLVLFQGYPFGNGLTGTFNRIAIGGARINKAES